MSETWDAVIIGAGVSGLAALRELDRAGMRVCLLEAQQRIGGRIFTVRERTSPAAIELGAEFVHGRPPETFEIAHRAGLTVAERAWNAVEMNGGEIAQGDGSGSVVEQVMPALEEAARNGPDESFASFIGRANFPESVKRRMTRYVEGFNAAEADVVGIASLAQDARAADRIEGGRSFFILDGYDAVPLALIDGMEAIDEKLRLNSLVERIEWKPGLARVHVRSALHERRETLTAHRVIVTVPLGVLQALPDARGAIGFDPEPAEVLQAARSLAFGQVYRVTLRLDDTFWKKRPELAQAGFIFSQEKEFRSWWRMQPVESQWITGWSAGASARALVGQARAEVFRRAVEALERISGVCPLPVLEGHFHDWHADPLFRGAYSYVPAGRLAAREVLAAPVEGTLYFAGEAANLEGHSATVHGAIGSGVRAARQVIEG